jgi:hypothetical protein
MEEEKEECWECEEETKLYDILDAVEGCYFHAERRVCRKCVEKLEREGRLLWSPF